MVRAQGRSEKGDEGIHYSLSNFKSYELFKKIENLVFGNSDGEIIEQNFLSLLF